MAFCGVCGAPVDDRGRFCGQCGAALTATSPETTMAAEPPEEPTQVLPSGGSACVRCGAVNEPSAAFCWNCGAAQGAVRATPAPAQDSGPVPHAVVPGVSPAARHSPGMPFASGPAPAPSPKPRRRWIGWVALALLLLVIAAGAAVAAYVFLLRDDAAEQAVTLAESASVIVAALDVPHADVDAAVVALKATEASLESIRTAGDALAIAVAVAEQSAVQLEPLTPAETRLTEALDDALTADAAYAAALADLVSDPDEFTRREASAVEALAVSAADAYEALSSTVPALPAITVETGAYERWERVARIVKRRLEMKRYLQQLARIMRESGHGREILNDGYDELIKMDEPPDDPITMFEEACDSRELVLDELDVMEVPDNAKARRLRTLFVKGVEYSLLADEAYLAWGRTISAYYYSPPAGYQGLEIEKLDELREARRLNEPAGKWKRRYVRLYNELAKKHGLRHDWVVTDI